MSPRNINYCLVRNCHSCFNACCLLLDVSSCCRKHRIGFRDKIAVLKTGSLKLLEYQYNKATCFYVYTVSSGAHSLMGIIVAIYRFELHIHLLFSVQDKNIKLSSCRKPLQGSSYKGLRREVLQAVSYGEGMWRYCLRRRNRSQEDHSP